MKSHPVYKMFPVEQRRAFVRITKDVRRDKRLIIKVLGE